MSEPPWEAPTLAGRALCDLGQQLATMRADRDRLKAKYIDLLCWTHAAHIAIKQEDERAVYLAIESAVEAHPLSGRSTK